MDGLMVTILQTLVDAGESQLSTLNSLSRDLKLNPELRTLANVLSLHTACPLVLLHKPQDL